MKSVFFLLVGVIQVTVWGVKVLYEADRLEDLPLSKYNLDSESLSIGVDIVRNRVMLVSNEEDGIIPQSRPFPGTSRKILQDVYNMFDGLLAADCSYDGSCNDTQINIPSAVKEPIGTPFVESSKQETTASTGSFVYNPDDNSVDFESIVGIDEREKVVDTMAYPYRTIGRLQFRCNSGLQVCTATLIGPRTIITNAHCIYNSAQGSDCGEYQFSPGQQGDFTPFGTVKATKLFYPAKYQSTTNTEDDYGILILERDVGQEAGWMGVGYTCDSQKQDLETAGYPNDKDNFSKTMYNSKCPQQDVNACPCKDYAFNLLCPQAGQSITFKHTCDTFRGQSGSPIWANVGPQFPIVRGIHSSGFGSGFFVADQRNTAVTVGQVLYQYITDKIDNN